MAITDIQISEELQTNAPSIKYSGNEGPKSPQEMQKMRMAQLEEEYSRYVEDMIEQGLEPMSLQQFMEQAMAEGQMAGGNPLPQDPTKPVNPFQPKPTGPTLPDRQMAAYGGIMGLDGRRKYGLGSRLRKLIPNELAKVAEVAAPFVAPFNPLAAGLMSGIGGYDRTGNIGSSLKSGLMNYGLGQGARYLGGAGLQKGLSLKMPGATTGGGIGNYFSKPIGTNQTGFNKWFGKGKDVATDSVTEGVGGRVFTDDEAMIVGDPRKPLPDSVTKNLLTTIKDFALDTKLLTGLAAGTLGATALMGNMEPEEIQDMQRGEGLDIDGIRAEVQEAMADETGELLKALRVKYPFLGRRDTKDYAMGGRIGRAEGGLMDLGGMEKDYRAEGGFVPIGAKEKADDVPARLSVNEFVFTADAVRNAGGGDIDRGAEVMENMMKNLEQGGQVSEESQGMQGAQQMFETSERLSEVI